jgi:hypothetical protein
MTGDREYESTSTSVRADIIRFLRQNPGRVYLAFVIPSFGAELSLLPEAGWPARLVLPISDRAGCP